MFSDLAAEEGFPYFSEADVAAVSGALARYTGSARKTLEADEIAVREGRPLQVRGDETTRTQGSISSKRLRVLKTVEKRSSPKNVRCTYVLLSAAYGRLIKGRGRGAGHRLQKPGLSYMKMTGKTE